MEVLYIQKEIATIKNDNQNFYASHDEIRSQSLVVW